MLDIEFEVGGPYKASDHNAIVDESVVYGKRIGAEHRGGSEHAHPRFEQAYARLTFAPGGEYFVSDSDGIANLAVLPDSGGGAILWMEAHVTLRRPFRTADDYMVIALSDGRWVCPVDFDSMTPSFFRVAIPISLTSEDTVTILVYGGRQ